MLGHKISNEENKPFGRQVWGLRFIKTTGLWVTYDRLSALMKCDMSWNRNKLKKYSDQNITRVFGITNYLSHLCR